MAHCIEEQPRVDVVAARITIRGRVQGVGYRWFARDAAATLSGPGHPLTGAAASGASGTPPPGAPTPPSGTLSGWVRNRRDGSVELEVAGPEPLVQALLERLRRGPPAAAVSACEVQWLPAPSDPGPAGHAPSDRAPSGRGHAEQPEPGLRIRPTG
jgi:acylphosphatase